MMNFIVTLLFGWLGVHKFMQKKNGMGLLYLCTLGLFGIGWIYDCIVAFRSIGQKNTPAARPVQSSGPQITNEALERRLQIVEDCIKLIHSTNNADVFFPRYNLLLQTLLEVGDYVTHEKFQGAQQQNIRNFIIRSYNAALVRADSMKTEKGKYNQYLKAYEGIEKYREHLSDETGAFLEEKFAPKLYGE